MLSVACYNLQMPPTVIELFMALVSPEPMSGCWLWTGKLNYGGYGWFFGRKTPGSRLAHRVAYELFVGAVPAGLRLDHLCRVRSCVNPTHLEAVTERVNILRGVGVCAMFAARTHCKNGHPFTEENTGYREKSGWRLCRTCDRIYKAKYNRRIRHGDEQP